MFDKDILLKSFPEGEDRFIFSSVLDAAKGALLNREKRFSQFLEPERLERYAGKLANIPRLCLMNFGGAEGCERRILGIYPDYMEISREDFPVAALKITGDTRFGGKIGHRDYLGSILSLGVARKKIGDIFVQKEYAVAFVYSDIAQYLALNLERAGGARVRAEITDPSAIQIFGEEPVFRCAAVASLRLDAVIAAAFGLSRSKAEALVEGSLVRVNWKNVSSPALKIKESDVISLRGYGRTILSEIKGKTKKDRINVILGRYV